MENKIKENTKKNKKSHDKIKELELEIKELKLESLRSLADFENYRRRKELELIKSKDDAVTSFIIDLLPSIDNFELSLKMTENKSMFIKGVEMIHKNLLDILKSNKIEEFIPNKGEKFDPYLHEPILIESNNETDKHETVIKTLQKGYKKADKLIRPAKVQVLKPKNN